MQVEERLWLLPVDNIPETADHVNHSCEANCGMQARGAGGRVDTRGPLAGCGAAPCCMRCLPRALLTLAGGRRTHPRAAWSREL